VVSFFLAIPFFGGLLQLTNIFILIKTIESQIKQQNNSNQNPEEESFYEASLLWCIGDTNVGCDFMQVLKNKRDSK